MSVSSGRVQWRHADGTLEATLDTTLGGFTTGMAFDSTGKLYVTDFSANRVSRFDTDGTLLGTFGGTNIGTSPESIVFDASGNAYVGHRSGDEDVRKFDATGNLVSQFNVAVESAGSDWVELAPDQCTLLYTSEGKKVLRFDVCTNTQLSDFATGLPGSQAFALRLLPGGGAIVADQSAVVRLNASGSVIQSYDAAGENSWFAANLDPDGTSFWSAGSSTSRVYKFDIASGNELLRFNTGTLADTVFGLALFAEPPPLPVDFGDAPDTYGTLRGSDGPQHQAQGPSLGSARDTEADAQLPLDGTGDDATDSDDEDGVVVPSLSIGASVTATVQVGGGSALLDAWIDFDRDGTFEPGERITATGGAAVSAGSNSLTFTVPATAVSGSSFARFRLSTVGGLDPTHLALDGEVEDYAVTIGGAADLAVTKTESADPVVAGRDNLTYVVTVANTGPVDITGISLSEDLTLPSGVTVVSVTPSQGTFTTTTAPDGTWAVGDLSRGSSATLTVVLSVGSSTALGRDVICDTARITAADQSLSNTGDDSATQCTSVAREVDLAVTKTESADPVIAGRDNVTYLVTVRNRGPSDASNLDLDEDLTLPPGVTVASVTPSQGTFSTTTAPDGTWAVGTLSPGSSATLTVVLSVGAPTASGTNVICNTATVAAVTGTVVNSGDDAATECTSVTREVDLIVSKSESADPAIAGSGNLTYVVTVTNAGPSDASGVTLTEDVTLPSGVTVVSVTPSRGTFTATTAPDGTWTAGGLAQGDSATLTVVLAVAASTAPGTNVICDTATVTAANETLRNPGNDTATECTSVGRRVDLVVSKSESADPVAAGSGNLTYVVTVTNAGPSDASGVALREDLTLPPGVTVTSVTPSQGTFSTTTAPDGAWAVGNLSRGSSATLTVVLAVGESVSSGTNLICDTAAVTAANETLTNPGDDTATECTSVSREVDLVVSKSESADPVVAGSGNLTYVVTVTNAGPSSASGVELSEDLTLPSGVTVVSVTPSRGTFTTTTAPDGRWAVGGLPRGSSATLTVVLALGASTASGTNVVCNTATVAGANETLVNTGDDSATQCTSVTREVDLVVRKTESSDPVFVVAQGAMLTYVVSVTNAGPSEASGVVLSETMILPSGVSVDSITPSSSTSFAGSTWTVGNLAASSSAALTVVLRVSPSTTLGTDVICDTATVTGATERLINPANDTATECTSVARQVDLVVTTTKSPEPVIVEGVSSTLVYVVTVSNAGPSDASGVVLSELLTLPPDVSVASITPSGSTSFAGTTWTVGDLPAGASHTLTLTLTVGPSTAPGPNVIISTATVVAANETLINPANDTATANTSVVAPGSATLAECPFNSNQLALVVVGLPLLDHLEVNQNLNTGVLEVASLKGFRFHVSFPAEGICAIIVFGLAGNDFIHVDSSDRSRVSIPAFVFGGPGNDHLHVEGGSENHVLVGGDGKDHLETGSDQIKAGLGRDLLIGGRGRDRLKASAGDNILVAGYTQFDGDMTALVAIRDEWTRTDQTYQERVDHLLTGGGRNGSIKLNPSTVHDDGDVDVLDGAPKTIWLDWFLANLDGDGDRKKKDKVSGLNGGRIATDINV